MDKKKGQINATAIMAVFGIVLAGIIVLTILQGFVDSGVLGTNTYALNATNFGQQIFNNFYAILPVLGTAMGGLLIFGVARRAGLV